MTPEWAAGFFEGEGHAQLMTGNRPNYKRLAMTIAQVFKEPLDVFAQAVGAGKVRGPYGPYSGNRQAHYQYMVYGEDAIGVAELLMPFLYGKKAQVDTALTAYKEYLNAK